jgi:hypothetical protein
LKIIFRLARRAARSIASHGLLLFAVVAISPIPGISTQATVLVDTAPRPVLVSQCHFDASEPV